MMAMKCKETGFHYRHAIPQAISRPAKMTWKSPEKLYAADATKANTRIQVVSLITYVQIEVLQSTQFLKETVKNG